MTSNRQTGKYSRVDWAMNRQAWRLSNGQYTPNEKDIEAFEVMAQWKDNQEKSTPKEHHLFAKLFIFIYMQILKKNNASIFDRTVLKDITSLLIKPLEDYYQDFYDMINSDESYQIFEENGIKMKPPIIYTEEERKEDHIKHGNMSQPDLKTIKHGIWTMDEVRLKLNEIITNIVKTIQ